MKGEKIWILKNTAVQYQLSCFLICHQSNQKTDKEIHTIDAQALNINIYVLKNIKHFENAGVCDDFDTLAAHYYLSDVMIFGKLCAILNKQENKRKVLLEANDLLAGEMYQENKDFIDKYFQ